MQDALTTIQTLDTLWPEPWQHFVLGLLAGAIIGLLIFTTAAIKGKVKF